MKSREERLEYLRAMREYVEAPLGEGCEPLDPHDKAPAHGKRMEIRKLPPGCPRGISDKAAHLIGQAVKSLLNS